MVGCRVRFFEGERSWTETGDGGTSARRFEGERGATRGEGGGEDKGEEALWVGGEEALGVGNRAEDLLGEDGGGVSSSSLSNRRKDDESFGSGALAGDTDGPGVRTVATNEPENSDGKKLLTCCLFALARSRTLWLASLCCKPRDRLGFRYALRRD